MKEKVKVILKESAKDYGLGDKALTQLAEQAAKALAEDATEEDIKAAAATATEYARLMQSAITRATAAQLKGKTAADGDPDDKGKTTTAQMPQQPATAAAPADTMPEWAKVMQTQLAAIQEENNKLKAEKARETRKGQIAAKAKERGIPDFMLKHLALPEDADIDKELDEIKQEIVNSGLKPKDQAHEPATDEKQMRETAEQWAKALPDK